LQSLVLPQFSKGLHRNPPQFHKSTAFHTLHFNLPQPQSQIHPTSSGLPLQTSSSPYTLYSIYQLPMFFINKPHPNFIITQFNFPAAIINHLHNPLSPLKLPSPASLLIHHKPHCHISQQQQPTIIRFHLLTYYDSYITTNIQNQPPHRITPPTRLLTPVPLFPSPNASVHQLPEPQTSSVHNTAIPKPTLGFLTRIGN